MQITQLYLKRNEKAVEEIRTTGDSKLPYFKLAMPPQEEGGKWIEVGAFWKAKNGTGYNFRVQKDISLELHTLQSNGDVMPFED